ncbi:hypothetical protein FY136_06210 [Agrobacterium tumefaciens]|uniref:hypothetical protein n=1 Tax=Agrobacterium tumefaciens TaxID=358 RepID=UPI0021D140D4|nr:hypothetical protein [Agrobacterium tumefaciens]UXT48856.1 hypothetical protein FY136_06210 [Agrobacterium tumefaciens]
MATVSDIADKIQELRPKYEALFRSNGWSLEAQLNTINGYLPTFPSSEVLDLIDHTSNRVRALKAEDLKKNGLGTFLGRIPASLTPMQFGHFANDPDAVLGGLLAVLQLIDARLPSEAVGPIKLDWEDANERNLIPKSLAKRVRSLDARISSLEPRSEDLNRKVSEIESAHAAAEQLPEDLEELAAKRGEVKELVVEAETLLEDIRAASQKVGELLDTCQVRDAQIQASEALAAKLIERSEQALRGSTGVGLAVSFENRKFGLSVVAGAWVVGLVGALVAAYFVGSERIRVLQTLITNESRPDVIWMNLALAVLGIGGPVWFAWISTKQIAITLKLAEDYAFKAAVSRAYEGYRSEAIQIDEGLKSRLFSSALDRLEEAPIRLMDKDNHGSPLQELINNPAIRNSLERVPGIVDKILGLIPAKSALVAGAGATAAVVMSSVPTASNDDEGSDEKASK